MMQRVPIRPRASWRRIVQEQGLVFHTDPGGNDYWREDAYYLFLEREIDEIDDATLALNELCLRVCAFVVENRAYERLRIPAWMIPAIEASWYAQDPTLYGRFDLVYDGFSPPKMLEFNADTPTSLLESSIIQHYWREDVMSGADQFNSIHEELMAQFGRIRALRNVERMHFACLQDNPEDTMNTAYLMDVFAQVAGGNPEHRSVLLDITELGFNIEDGTLRDARTDEGIAALFKLYPWEWLARDQFDVTDDPHIWAHVRNWATFLEPAWKMLLSNKGILPLLWELNPGHPNLLPAFFDGPGGVDHFVQKPLLSREGANVTIVKDNQIVHQTGGDYGSEGFVFQQHIDIPECDGRFPIIGSWIVGETPCGIGIREASSPITDNNSSFVPHIFE